MTTLPRINQNTLSLEDLRKRFATGPRVDDADQKQELETKFETLKKQIVSKTVTGALALLLAIIGFSLGISNFINVLFVVLGVGILVFVAIKIVQAAKIGTAIGKNTKANTATGNEELAAELLSRVTSPFVTFPIAKEAVRGFKKEESDAFIVRMQEFFKRRQSEFQISSVLFSTIKPLTVQRLPVYHCRLSVLFEQRRWNNASQAFVRQAIPASVTVTGTNVDVWHYAFAEQNEYQNSVSDYMVPESVDKHTCPACNGRNSSWTCHDCNGTGKTTCDKCQGRGKTTCTKCNGRGDELCYTCGGKGQESCRNCGWDGRTVVDGRVVTCSRCGGSGYTSCSRCGVTCRVRCSSCGGRGVNDCYSCGSRGHNTCYKCGGGGTECCPGCGGSGSVISYINVTQNLLAESKNEAVNVPDISTDVINAVNTKIVAGKDWTEIARQVVKINGTRDAAVAAIKKEFSEPFIARQLCDWFDGFKNKNDRVQHLEIVVSQTIVNYVEYDMGGNKCFVWLTGKDQIPDDESSATPSSTATTASTPPPSRFTSLATTLLSDKVTMPMIIVTFLLLVIGSQIIKENANAKRRAEESRIAGEQRDRERRIENEKRIADRQQQEEEKRIAAEKAAEESRIFKEKLDEKIRIAEEKRAKEKQIADEELDARLQPDLERAVDLEEELVKSGFDDKRDSKGRLESLKDFVTYGNASLKSKLNNVPGFSKETYSEAEKAKKNIQAAQAEISEKVFVAEFSFAISMRSYGDTMEIPTGFESSKIEKIIFSVPNITGETGRNSLSNVTLKIYGKKDSIEELSRNNNAYKARVWFKNLALLYNSSRADILKIEISDRIAEEEQRAEKKRAEGKRIAEEMRAEEKRIAEEEQDARFRPDIDRAVDLSLELKRSGFGDKRDSDGRFENLKDFVTYGSASFKTSLEKVQSNTSATDAAKDRVRKDILTAKAKITEKVFVADFSFSISVFMRDATMKIHTGFNSSKLEMITFPDPDIIGEMVGVSWSNYVELTLRGNRDRIQELERNKKEYKARVWFKNLQSDGPSADIVKIEIADIRAGIAPAPTANK